MSIFSRARARRRAGWVATLALLAGLALPAAASAKQLQIDDYAPLVLDNREPIPPGQVRARFIGVSTVLLDDGKDQILLDGFFSRPTLLKGLLMATLIEPDQGVIKRAMVRNGIGPRLRAVLVAHAHHDHALDTADVAAMAGRGQATPIVVMGSPSVHNVMRGRFRPEPWVFKPPPLSPAAAESFGAFRVWAIQTPHSPSSFTAGQVDQPVPRKASIFAYQRGPNYSYVVQHGDLQILLYPSAHAPFRPLPDSVRPDVIFLGVGNMGGASDREVDDYWSAVVRATDAPLVIPVHWDDIQQPLELDPRLPHRARFNGFLDDARKGMQRVFGRACEGPVDVRFMPFFTEIPLADAPPASLRAPRTAADPMRRPCADAGFALH